jgi:hypothetical protein
VVGTVEVTPVTHTLGQEEEEGEAVEEVAEEVEEEVAEEVEEEVAEEVGEDKERITFIFKSRW